MDKEAATDDGIVRIVQLEQERLTWRENPERPSTTGLPEVDFVEFRSLGEELVPIFVRDSDPGPHGRYGSSRAHQGALTS